MPRCGFLKDYRLKRFHLRPARLADLLAVRDGGVVESIRLTKDLRDADIVAIDWIPGGQAIGITLRHDDFDEVPEGECTPFCSAEPIIEPVRIPYLSESVRRRVHDYAKEQRIDDIEAYQALIELGIHTWEG